MSWRVTLPGTPPTLNKLYQPVWRSARGGRRYMGVGKNPVAKQYHDDCVMQLRVARPSSWRPAPETQIRLSFGLFLVRSIDADNVLKVLSDAVASAIDIDDRWFLPCVATKTEGLPLRDARVEIEIGDEGEHSH